MNGATLSTSSPPPVWMRLVFGRNPRRTLIRLLCLVAASFIVFRFILIPIRVSGLSMHPTYREGKISMINNLAYCWSKPQRGDIIALRVPEENNAVLLKRIVALPGERVRVVQGRVFINGELLDEPYARTKDGLSRKPLTLGPDEWFVVGDNRRISELGAIPEHYILGKVLF